jgi:hypothetical protein
MPGRHRSTLPLLLAHHRPDPVGASIMEAKELAGHADDHGSRGKPVFDASHRETARLNSSVFHPWLNVIRSARTGAKPIININNNNTYQYPRNLRITLKTVSFEPRMKHETRITGGDINPSGQRWRTRRNFAILRRAIDSAKSPERAMIHA